MWVISIIAVLIVAFFISYLLKEDICDTIPVTIAGLILILYFLAFFRKLNMIDSLSLIILIVLFLIVSFMKKEGRKDIFSAFRKTMLHTQTIMILLFIILFTILVRNQITTWWDDINYWSSDTKALYYLNGFAGKYGNVSPEFGDYPPALQLFKWWFTHFNPNGFMEGLMFAGYYCMNFAFSLPLLKKLKTKNILLQLLACFTLFLLPGVTNGICYSGTCADVTMGIVYGSLLWAIWDYAGHTSLYYYLRITLYLSVLVLTKSVGVEWAFFSLLFLLLFYRRWKSQKEIPFHGKESRKIVIAGVIGIVFEVSWLFFCLMNRRVAKLTSAGIKMATNGNYELPGNTMEKIGYYMKGFSLYPMHTDKTWVIDLSSLMLLILFFVIIILMKKKHVLDSFETKRIILFTVFTALAAYGIIFIGHITIFAGELQYLDAAVMALSISRYAAPFTIGMMYLLIGIIISRLDSKKAYIYCLLFILLTTNYPAAYQSLIGYQDEVKQSNQYNIDMIDHNAMQFLKLSKNEKELWAKRVLYLRDDNVIHWIKDTYVSFQASPIAVVYNGIDTTDMTGEDLGNKMMKSHASYLYVDKVAGDPGPLLDHYLEDGKFEYQTLYAIKNINGLIQLEKVKGLK